MTDSTAVRNFAEIQALLRLIEYPKYRNVELAVFKEKYEALISLKRIWKPT